MDAETNTADVDFDAISQGKGDAPEARGSQTLDRDARYHAQNSKYNKGEKVPEDDQSEEEGDGRNRHLVRAIGVMDSSATLCRLLLPRHSSFVSCVEE